MIRFLRTAFNNGETSATVGPTDETMQIEAQTDEFEAITAHAIALAGIHGYNAYTLGSLEDSEEIGRVVGAVDGHPGEYKPASGYQPRVQLPDGTLGPNVVSFRVIPRQAA
jgi:hypothetical protein